MKILILNSHLNSGGITRYCFNLSRGLIARGHQVTVASTGGSWADRFEDAGVRLWTVPLKTKAILSPQVFLSYVKLIRMMNDESFDVIHANTRVTHFLAAMLSRRCKIPYTAIFHGYYHRGLGRKLFACQGGLSIAISGSVAEHLEKDFKMPQSRIRVICNGSDESDFLTNQTRDDLRRKFNIKGAPVIGMLSRLSQEKNHEVFIKAFAKIIHDYPDAICIIAGRGRLKNQVQEQIKNLPCAGQIIMLDEAPVGEIFRILDICVVPSLEEGYGFVALESQLNKVPVVVSALGGLAEIVQDEVNGLWLRDPYNVDELAALLQRLWADPALRERLSTSGYDSARLRYSLERMCQDTESLYNELVMTNSLNKGCSL